MTPSLIAVGTAAESAASVLNPTTLVPGLPAGRANNDVLLLLTSCRLNTPTVATPAGWTQLFQDSIVTGGSGVRLAIYTRLVDGSETAPNVTWSGLAAGNACQAQIACVRGLQLLAGLPVVNVTGAFTSGQIQPIAGGDTIITTSAGAFIISFGSHNDDVGTVTAPATADGVTWTLISAPFTTSGNDKKQAWAYGIKAAAGTINAVQFAAAGGVASGTAGVMIAFGVPTQGWRFYVTP